MDRRPWRRGNQQWQPSKSQMSPSLLGRMKRTRPLQHGRNLFPDRSRQVALAVLNLVVEHQFHLSTNSIWWWSTNSTYPPTA